MELLPDSTKPTWGGTDALAVLAAIPATEGLRVGSSAYIHTAMLTWICLQVAEKCFKASQIRVSIWLRNVNLTEGSCSI